MVLQIYNILRMEQYDSEIFWDMIIQLSYRCVWSSNPICERQLKLWTWKEWGVKRDLGSKICLCLTFSIYHPSPVWPSMPFRGIITFRVPDKQSKTRSYFHKCWICGSIAPGTKYRISSAHGPMYFHSNQELKSLNHRDKSSW